MSSNRCPNKSHQAAWTVGSIVPLPPGLQIDPIQEASAPANRKLNAVVSALVSFTLFGGGFYLIERSQRDYFRTMKGDRQIVRLLLQYDLQLNEAPGGGGGRGSKHFDLRPDQSNNPAISALNPISLRTEAPEEVADELVPLDAPKAFPELKASFQIPLIPGVGVGSGVGNGAGSGVGNGIGNSLGRGRGTTWIHSASGGEGVQVAESFMEVKDYIPPEYPDAARRVNISGDVIIEVTIDDNGKPIKWNVLEGQPFLTEASLKVFPRWRFVPVRYKGKKVSATFEVRIRFTLV